MPSNWLYIDSNFPTFTGDENLKEQVTTIQNYMYMLWSSCGTPCTTWISPT